MDEYIARLNIAHFKKLLAEETDESHRAKLEDLLRKEKELLSAAVKKSKTRTGT